MFLILMLVLVRGEMDTLEFKKTKLFCSDISYVYYTEKYEKVGLVAAGNSYLSNEKTIDDLQKEINRQCVKKLDKRKKM